MIELSKGKIFLKGLKNQNQMCQTEGSHHTLFYVNQIRLIT